MNLPILHMRNGRPGRERQVAKDPRVSQEQSQNVIAGSSPPELQNLEQQR